MQLRDANKLYLIDVDPKTLSTPQIHNPEKYTGCGGRCVIWRGWYTAAGLATKDVQHGRSAVGRMEMHPLLAAGAADRD